MDRLNVIAHCRRTHRQVDFDIPNTADAFSVIAKRCRYFDVQPTVVSRIERVGSQPVVIYTARDADRLAACPRAPIFKIHPTKELEIRSPTRARL